MILHTLGCLGKAYKGLQHSCCEPEQKQMCLLNCHVHKPNNIQKLSKLSPDSPTL